MTPKKLGILAFFILIATAATGSIFYTMYQLKDHQEFISNPKSLSEKIEKAEGKTITLMETKDGRKKWVIKASEIKYTGGSSTANLTDVKGLVYGDKQEVLFTFSASSGKYYKEKKRLFLTRGVKMISPSKGIVIKAPTMDWSSRRGIVTASGGVEMTKKDFGVSKAEKAIFSTDFSKIQFKGKATSVIGI